MYSADLSPGLIPGIYPPYFLKFSAVSVGLKTIEVQKKQKKIIPEAYSNMYKGCPCVNMDEILINKSESVKPKFETVTGSNNRAEANIAGITPAVLIFNGK